MSERHTTDEEVAAYFGYVMNKDAAEFEQVANILNEPGVLFLQPLERGEEDECDE